MRVTTKMRILSYLQARGWVSGTELEGQAVAWFSKPSIVARRVSELAADGFVERGKTERNRVQYRIPVKAPVQTWSDAHAVSWLHDA